MNRLYFHNQQHYGDCLISLHYLIGLSQSNNIECEFYCNPSYHSQLQELISENVNVFSNSFGNTSIDPIKDGDLTPISVTAKTLTSKTP